MKIDWKDYLSDIDKLNELGIFRALHKGKRLVNCLIGISRGGLFPATVLSNKHNLPLAIVNVESYKDKKQGKIKLDSSIINKSKIKGSAVLVDDLLDSGNTLLEVRKMLKKKFPRLDLKTVVLYNKDIERPKEWRDYVDYYVRMLPNEWVEFPYEVTNDKPSRVN